MLVCSYFCPLHLALDLRHNCGEGISLRRRQVGLFVFAEYLKQVNRLFGAVIVVDYPHTTAFSSAAPGKSKFANTSRACKNIALQRVRCQEIDKLTPPILRQEFFGTRCVVARLYNSLHS
jgi:hypothetical protein